MDPTKLLLKLQESGIRLSIEGNRLGYDAPKGAMTAEVRAKLELHKGDLISILVECEAKIHMLASIARERCGETVEEFILEHAERWPKWVAEYHSMKVWMSEEMPGCKEAANDLAARAVIGWIAHQDLGVITLDGYHTDLAGLWERLGIGRKGKSG